MATQSEIESSGTSGSSTQTGDIKKFIDAFNAELEKLYTAETKKLGPWKKSREEAIKITKLRKGTWPVDPAVKTIGDLFAYVFFDPDGVNYKIPPYFIISNGVNRYVDDALEQQYGDWIDDMNGVSVSDPSIGVIFKSLANSNNSSNWKGNERRTPRPIVLSDSARIIQNYNEIKKPGITNPDKYSAGQYWFDSFISEVVGLNGLPGYLKSSKRVDDDPRYNGLHVTWGSNNDKIKEMFSTKLLDNNKRVEKSFSFWGTIGDGTYSDPVYNDRDVYTISVSKFAKGETVPYPIIPYQYDRHNYADYGSERQGYHRGIGFAKILDETGGGGYNGFDIRDFDDLKTQYRPGVNSIESLSKDPLFNFHRTDTDDIKWTSTGTQSQETGIYWDYSIEAGVTGTVSVVGKFEQILLYNAFLEAGDNYQTITIPKKAPEPKVEPPVVSTLVPTTESKLSGEFTFNVEKKDTFVVVGNQNFALKIGDLVIEGLTTSVTPVIESPKTIDLGDGIVIIDDGELDEDIYIEQSFQGEEETPPTSIRVDYTPTSDDKQSVVTDTNSLEGSVVITAPKDGSMTISATGLKHLKRDEGSRATVYDDADGKSKSSWGEVSGFPTVGVGHLIQNNERAAFSKYLKPGKMSDDAIDNLLLSDLQSRIIALNKKLKVKVTQNQFDALLSMMFNTGAGNKSFLKAVSLTNEGKFKEASDQIRSGPKTSKGKELAGLVRRRNGEADTYMA